MSYWDVFMGNAIAVICICNAVEAVGTMDRFIAVVLASAGFLLAAHGQRKEG